MGFWVVWSLPDPEGDHLSAGARLSSRSGARLRSRPEPLRVRRRFRQSSRRSPGAVGGGWFGLVPFPAGFSALDQELQWRRGGRKEWMIRHSGT